MKKYLSLAKRARQQFSNGDIIETSSDPARYSFPIMLCVGQCTVSLIEAGIHWSIFRHCYSRIGTPYMRSFSLHDWIIVTNRWPIKAEGIISFLFIDCSFSGAQKLTNRRGLRWWRRAFASWSLTINCERPREPRLRKSNLPLASMESPSKNQKPK